LKNRSRVPIVIAPVGRLIKKHHLQVAFSVRAPPTIGATTVPSTYNEVRNPVNNARLSGGVTIAMTERPPETTPAPPMPATARPIMNILELVATPQRSEPNRNMMKKIWYVHLKEKIVAIFPLNGCREHIVKGYAAPYQPMSVLAWNWLVMDGIAY
jgi:hypothetical protein